MRSSVSAFVVRLTLAALALGVSSLAIAAEGATTASAPATAGDPHYTSAGFFDAHYCNWPDRPKFLLVLFSTTRFAEVERIDVFTPGGERLGSLDLTRYRVVEKKGKPPKRVFMSQMEAPAEPVDGWYRAEIVLRDGSRHEGRDYVVHRSMERPRAAAPAHGETLARIPAEIAWQPVPGATRYKLYLHDFWDGGKLIYESPLVSEPRAKVPKGLLEAGGTYRWRVNARDLDGHELLGDFNHGSLSEDFEFTLENRAR